MKTKPSGYKAYFPDDGEGPEDAREIKTYDWQSVYDAEDAAEHACEYDHSERDGWERSMAGGQTSEFAIVVIDPMGQEVRYKGWHEVSIEHRVTAEDPVSTDQS